MNQQQFEQMIRGQMKPKQSLLSTITQNELYEAVDLFIKRCYDEKGYCKQSLLRDIHLHLQGNPNPNVVTCISEVELEVLPVVMQRLQEKY